MTDNTHKKIIGEIIDLIALGANGRIVAFEPEKSDKDLVVEKRADYEKKNLSFKIYSNELSNNHNFEELIHNLAKDKNLKKDKDFYLIFVGFDVLKQVIEETFLVIPSLVLEKLSQEKDFSKYLVGKKDFVRFLMDSFLKK